MQQDREPLRGTCASEREIFRVFSEVLRCFQRFSEVFRSLLRDPLSGRFPAQRLSVLLPLFVLPLALSPTEIADFFYGGAPPQSGGLKRLPSLDTYPARRLHYTPNSKIIEKCKRKYNFRNYFRKRIRKCKCNPGVTGNCWGVTGNCWGVIGNCRGVFAKGPATFFWVFFKGRLRRGRLMREGQGSKWGYSGRAPGPSPSPLVRQVCKHPAFSVSPVVPFSGKIQADFSHFFDNLLGPFSGIFG